VPFLVLAVIFSVGLRLPLGGAPYVYGFAAAYVPWTLLAGAITAAASSIVELRFLVKRARFPVALIPSAPSLTHTIPHVVLLALTGIACFAGGYGGPALVTLPYFYVCAIVLALGVGLCLSATAVIVRDVTRAVPVALQLWFWLTPVAWTPARLPAYGRRLLDFNPAAYVVDGYRHALMPRAFPAPTLVQSAIFWLLAVAVLAGGAYWFKRLRPQFWECL
jgi:ABC-type polysaccharide/polyol phosphate export permease